MQQTISRTGLKILWVCFMHTPVKSVDIPLKSAIGAELEKHMLPITMTNMRTGEFFDQPNTGPGYDEWAWAESGQVDFTVDRAAHLHAAFKSILDKDGFPSALWRGLQELDVAFPRWTAKQAE